MTGPVPYVTLAGETITPHADEWDSTVTALTGLTVRGGRSEPLMGPTPVGTAEFSVWDPVGDLGAAFKPRSVDDQPVVVGWTWGAESLVIFRGVVVTTSAVARTIRGRKGWVVTITAGDNLLPTDLVMFRTSGGNVAQQGHNTRATDMSNTRANQPIAGFDPVDGLSAWQYRSMASPEPQQTSMRRITNEFYWTTGHAYTFVPHTNRVRPVYHVSPRAIRQYLHPDGVHLTSQSQTHGGTTFAPLPLDARQWHGDSALAYNQESAINTVSVSYTNSSGDQVREASTAKLTRQSIRELAVTGRMVSGSRATTTANLLLAAAINEYALPLHPPIRLDTRYTPFESPAQAKVLTACWEHHHRLVLAGDPWATYLDVPPSFEVMAWEVAYEKQYWQVTIQPCWCRFTDPGTTWGDLHEDITVNGTLSFHPAVTIADIGWIADPDTIEGHP